MFGKDPDREGLAKPVLALAMKRLLKAERIKIETPTLDALTRQSSSYIPWSAVTGDRQRDGQNQNDGDKDQ